MILMLALIGEKLSGVYVLASSGKAVKERFVPQVGEVIDRYGSANGRYTSPVIDGKSFSYTETHWCTDLKR